MCEPQRIAIRDLQVDEFGWRTLPPPPMQFDVILAEPPFHLLNNSGAESGGAGDAPRTTVTALRGLPVGELCREDGACLLFMWTSGPHMAKALDLVHRWRFDFRTVLKVWARRSRVNFKRTVVSHRFGASSTEYLLLATRGSAVAIDRLLPRKTRVRESSEWPAVPVALRSGRTGRPDAKPIIDTYLGDRGAETLDKIHLFAEDTRAHPASGPVSASTWWRWGYAVRDILEPPRLAAAPTDLQTPCTRAADDEAHGTTRNPQSSPDRMSCAQDWDDDPASETSSCHDDEDAQGTLLAKRPKLGIFGPWNASLDRGQQSGPASATQAPGQLPKIETKAQV